MFFCSPEIWVSGSLLHYFLVCYYHFYFYEVWQYTTSSLGNSLKMQQKNRPYKRIQQVGEKNVHFKIVQGNFPEKRA